MLDYIDSSLDRVLQLGNCTCGASQRTDVIFSVACMQHSKKTYRYRSMLSESSRNRISFLASFTHSPRNPYIAKEMLKKS